MPRQGLYLNQIAHFINAPMDVCQGVRNMATTSRVGLPVHRQPISDSCKSAGHFRQYSKGTGPHCKLLPLSPLVPMAYLLTFAGFCCEAPRPQRLAAEHQGESRLGGSSCLIREVVRIKSVVIGTLMRGAVLAERTVEGNYYNYRLLIAVKV